MKANKQMLEKLNASLGLKRPEGHLNSFSVIFDEVDTDVVKQVTQWIIESNFGDEQPDILNLLICSPGGELAAAFAIIDIMKSSRIPIRTVGLGQIASAALMIFMTGAKGHRILTPNTSIMSHSWSGGNVGKADELFAHGKEFVLTQERMIGHYVKFTGLSEKNVRKFLLPPHDVFLSADEALKVGLCDKVANLD